ncbi:MAG: acyl-ACP thioesterase domain-containing protein [Bacteroidota bacterium]
MKTNLKQKIEFLQTSPLHEVIPVTVAAATVGPNGLLTVPNLIRVFQEAAMRNTVRLKISSPELIAAEGLSWILRRQRITILQLPAMGQATRVITAPSGFARRLQTFRDFHLIDEHGTPLAAATSQWLLLDVNSRRLRPIPDHIATLSKSLAPAAAHLDPPTGKIPPPAAPNLSVTARVAYYQLDFNKHLTNPVFPELMLEPLGADFLSQQRPTLVDIDFRAEAYYGENLTAYAQKSATGFQHGLYRGDDLLATMTTEWSE